MGSVKWKTSMEVKMQDTVFKNLSKILDELTAIGRECKEHDPYDISEYDHALIHVDRATKMVEELMDKIRGD